MWQKCVQLRNLNLSLTKDRLTLNKTRGSQVAVAGRGTIQKDHSCPLRPCHFFWQIGDYLLHGNAILPDSWAVVHLIAQLGLCLQGLFEAAADHLCAQEGIFWVWHPSHSPIGRSCSARRHNSCKSHDNSQNICIYETPRAPSLYLGEKDRVAILSHHRQNFTSRSECMLQLSSPNIIFRGWPNCNAVQLFEREEKPDSSQETLKNTLAEIASKPP